MSRKPLPPTPSAQHHGNYPWWVYLRTQISLSILLSGYGYEIFPGVASSSNTHPPSSLFQKLYSKERAVKGSGTPFFHPEGLKSRNTTVGPSHSCPSLLIEWRFLAGTVKMRKPETINLTQHFTWMTVLSPSPIP